MAAKQVDEASIAHVRLLLRDVEEAASMRVVERRYAECTASGGARSEGETVKRASVGKGNWQFLTGEELTAGSLALKQEEEEKKKGSARRESALLPRKGWGKKSV